MRVKYHVFALNGVNLINFISRREILWNLTALEIYTLRFRLNLVRCLRRLAAKFKACEHRRCFKFNRLLVDYTKSRAVNLGLARRCGGSKQYKSRRKNKPRSLGLASGFYRRSTISRMLYGEANITRRPFSYRFYASSALQIRYESTALYKI